MLSVMAMTGSVYGFRDVLRLTGATRSQLIHWLNRGVIQASVQASPGTGVPNLFSFDDLVCLSVITDLVIAFSVPTSQVRILVPRLRDALRQQPPLEVLVVKHLVNAADFRETRDHPALSGPTAYGGSMQSITARFSKETGNVVVVHLAAVAERLRRAGVTT